ncbi:hypothetical protein AB3X91_41120 [Paraburkholderia sp. BR14263]|uniref:hypothetical protein n=1 Tax=unclassified Paraburkholderia TaxID=2615204 RepID=UPI0034CEA068
MNDRSIRQFAVSIALIAFAIVKSIDDRIPDFLLWIAPGGDISRPSWPFVSSLLAAAFAGLKIGLLIVLLEQFLYRFFARRIIGRWVYESTTGNFGIAVIAPRGFWAGGTTLTYSVNLYRNGDDAFSAMKQTGDTAPFGTADGIVTSFKDDKLTLIYQVHIGSEKYSARKGILSISPSPDSGIMTGIWESTKINDDAKVPDRDVRVGDLKMYRYRRFHQIWNDLRSQSKLIKAAK